MKTSTLARLLSAVIVCGLVALGIGTASVGAAVTDYPDRPVKIVVGYGPGGTGDLTIRIIAQKLSQSLGQAFVVENRPGAGGIVASQMAQKTKPDGYTLNFIAAGNFAMTPSLFKSLPFDPIEDFDMVSLIGTFGFALIVNGKSEMHTLQSLVKQAKSKQKDFFIATVSVGSAQYLSAQMFKSMAGLDINIVPYKSSADVIRAVRAGDVDAAFETIAPLIPHVSSGDIRAIAVTEKSRFSGLPDVPTISESGLSDYAVSAWNGLAAPRGTPPEIIAKLNSAIHQAVQASDTQQQFQLLGVTAKANTPGQMTQLLRSDTDWWKHVIEAAGIPKQ
ncbi:hypothetical protein CAP48_06125 [Advenella sp. S44]|uniref:Bug family tripartite tricarboxylate transporter substrate binding protein n=1 Tax=Advenella sp. S44 TaxID=1982755 RepID=UPI000C2ABA73|nr:tripartite tricarboxylate transporter substrate-binding protein [Advenella sp. S44]PJX25619.1 hypothetical protein CAP48_06125 [Advenella sp. S44]